MNAKDIVLNGSQSATKEKRCINSTYMRCLELSNSWRQKAEWCSAGDGGKIRAVVFNGSRGSGGED